MVSVLSVNWEAGSPDEGEAMRMVGRLRSIGSQRCNDKTTIKGYWATWGSSWWWVSESMYEWMNQCMNEYWESSLTAGLQDASMHDTSATEAGEEIKIGTLCGWGRGWGSPAALPSLQLLCPDQIRGWFMFSVLLTSLVLLVSPTIPK